MRKIISLIELDLVIFFRNKESIFWSFIFPIILITILGISNFNDSDKLIIDSNCLEKLVKDKTLHSLFVSLQKKETSISKIECIENNYFVYGSVVSEKFNVHENIKFIITKQNDYLYSIIPGILSLGLLNSSLWGIGMFLIDSRSKGILKNIYILPVNKFDYFISLIISKFITGLIEFMLTYIFCYLIFDFEFKNSLFLIFLTIFLASLCFGSIGLLLGSQIKSYNYGNGLINIITFPIMLTSGVFFKIDYLPEVIQKIVTITPLQSMIKILCNPNLEFFPFFVLIIYFIISFGATFLIFKWD